MKMTANSREILNALKEHSQQTLQANKAIRDEIFRWKKMVRNFQRNPEETKN